MLAALLAGPATCAELAERVGVGPSGAGKLVTALRTRGNTLVRVAGWQEQPDGQRGRPAPIYALGDGRPDADPIPAVTHSERNRAYRLRDRERWLTLRAAANKRAKQRRVGVVQAVAVDLLHRRKRR